MSLENSLYSTTAIYLENSLYSTTAICLENSLYSTTAICLGQQLNYYGEYIFSMTKLSVNLFLWNKKNYIDYYISFPPGSHFKAQIKGWNA